MPLYKITRKEPVNGTLKLVAASLSLPAVERYMVDVNANLAPALKIKGASLKTLKRKFKNNLRYSLGNGEFVIEKDDRGYMEKGYTVGRKLAKNVPRNKVVQFEHTSHNVTTHSFRNPYQLTEANKHKFLSFILSEIKKHGSINIKQRFYQIRMQLDNDAWINTHMFDIHTVVDELVNLIDAMTSQYADSPIMKIEIRYKAVANMGNRIVFGKKNGLDHLNVFINKTLKGKDSELRSNLLVFINKYNIVSPNTTKNCFYHACIISEKKGVNDHAKYDKFISNNCFNTNEDLTINDKCSEFSLFFSCGVDIVDGINFIDNDTMFKYEPTLEKRVKILVFGSHAYGLYPRDHKIDDHVIRKPVYKYAQKIVTPTYKDQYKHYKLMTWDLETCNTSVSDKNKTATKVYASGCIYERDVSDKKEWKITLNAEGKKIKKLIKPADKEELTKDGKTKYIDDNYVYKEIYATKPDQDVISDFLNYINCLSHKNLMIYAHNGGKFDAWFLIEKIIKSNLFYIRDVLVQNGRILNLHVIDKFNSRNILFRDSMTFLSMSLSEACEDFKPDVTKLTDTVDHNLINYENCYTQQIYDYTSKYLKHDVVSLFLLLKDFNRLIDNTYGFGIRDVLTNAAIARRIYMTKFNDKYQMYTCSEEHDKLIRSSYYGGRNECFTKMGIIDEVLFYLDFTSLYPFVMKKYKYGYGRLFEKWLTEYDESLFGYYHVYVKHTDQAIKDKVLPLHGVMNNGKLEFPHIPKFTLMVLSSEEIRFSKQNNCGYEYKYVKALYYEFNDYIFKEPVDHLYKMKLDAEKIGNDALRAIAKIIINSLYGFWGIKCDDREQFEIKRNNSQYKNQAHINHHLYSGTLIEDHTVDDYSFIKYTQDIEVNSSNIGVASMVCSNARMELYTVLKKIKDKGYNVYYCDTDSIVTNYNPYTDVDKSFIKKYMSDSGALGQLVNETKVYGGCYTKMYSLGLKQYALINPDLKGKSKKWEVLKFKGLNVKKTYMNKHIDHDNKKIYYTDLSMDGEHKIDITDYEYLAKGYNMECDNMTFLANSSILLKDKPIYKLENNKVLKKGYTKGVVNTDDNTIETMLLSVSNSFEREKKRENKEFHDMFTF